MTSGGTSGVSLGMRRSNSGRRRSGSRDGDAGQNQPILTEELIKTAAQVFDSALVFKLNFSGRGVNTLRPMALHGCINLTELDLSCNQLDRIQGLERCTSLRRLILASNRIAAVEGLQGLESLEALMLQGNRIRTLADLNLQMLSSLPKLKSLYLQNLDGSNQNPAVGQEAYRKLVLRSLPSLHNLDGERRPQLTGYSHAAQAAMDAAAEAEMEINIDDLELPPARPWLQEWDWEDSGRADCEAMLKPIAAQQKGVQLKVDQCKAILKAIKEAQTKVKRNVSAAR